MALHRETSSSSIRSCHHQWNFSQTWELRPPKGLGVSGPIFQVVSFARFGSKIFNMELYTCPCASHDIGDRWLPCVSGGVIGNDHDKRSLQTWWSLIRSAYELKVRPNKKSAFRSIWRVWSLFSGWIDALGRPLVSAIRISQVVAFSRTLSVHLNPRIEGTEIECPQFSGGRFCQVVARTGSTVAVISIFLCHLK